MQLAEPPAGRRDSRHRGGAASPNLAPEHPAPSVAASPADTLPDTLPPVVLRGVRNSRSLSNLWSLILNFGRRDLKTKFKGAVLGWLWSLVVPLATLAIYSVVFSIIFRADPPALGNGRSGIFVLWLFCGLTAWTFFQSTLNQGINSLVNTGQLLQKVYFPAYAPVLGSTLAVGVQSLIELGLLAAIFLLLLNAGCTWLLIPLWAAAFLVFTTSLTIAVSVLNIYYRDLAHLVTISLQLWFYLTPVIYPLSMVPESWNGLPLQTLLQLNPLTQFVELFRALIYELNWGSWQMWASVSGWTLAAWLLALVVLRHKGADLGEHV